MDLSVGGSNCTGSVAYESPDIGAIRYCFRFFIFCPILNQSTQNMSGAENGEKNRGGSVEKQGRVGGDVYTNYPCHTSILSVGILFTWQQSAVSSH